MDDSPKLAGRFMFPTFRTKYEGISDTLNIRKTKYYKPKGGQTIDLHKEDGIVVKKVYVNRDDAEENISRIFGQID